MAYAQSDLLNDGVDVTTINVTFTVAWMGGHIAVVPQAQDSTLVFPADAGEGEDTSEQAEGSSRPGRRKK